MAKKKYPKVIDEENLAIKGTKELLWYLNKLQKCEESFTLSDMIINPDITDSNYIYFKNTLKWKSAYQIVKTILAKREHITK